ncbi:MAG: hypothetical protein ABJE95_11840 [Byssovorax sp.]
MSQFTAQEYERRADVIEGWEVGITTYRLGDRCFCKIDNVSPGALIARAVASTRAEAESVALGSARSRLAATRRRPIAKQA